MILIGDMRGIGKRFVYTLSSEADSSRHDVGNTSDVDEQLEWHNHGRAVTPPITDPG